MRGKSLRESVGKVGSLLLAGGVVGVYGIAEAGEGFGALDNGVWDRRFADEGVYVVEEVESFEWHETHSSCVEIYQKIGLRQLLTTGDYLRIRQHPCANRLLPPSLLQRQRPISIYKDDSRWGFQV